MIDCFAMFTYLLTPPPSRSSFAKKGQNINIFSRRIGLTPCQGQTKINGHAVWFLMVNMGVEHSFLMSLTT